MLVWADLSTFDVAAARRFYRGVLGWRFDADDAGYVIARARGRAAAGLFAMPQKFRDLGMPPFWMSYARVDDLDAVVQAAAAHGGTIEVRPEPAPGGGRIALIRDPAGAGFTCIEGGGFDAARGPQLHGPQPHGARVWHELHVADLEPVGGFYRAVLGWVARPTATEGRYRLDDAAGEPVAGVQVRPDALRGDKQYWGVYFSVNGLDAAAARVRRAGGAVVAEPPLATRRVLLAYDPQGAAFHMVEAGDGACAEAGARRRCRWRAGAGLAAVAAALVLDAGWGWSWGWGVLCLAWVVPDLRRGATYLFEEVERRHHPVLYGLIVATWVLLGVSLLWGSWGA